MPTPIVTMNTISTVSASILKSQENRGDLLATMMDTIPTHASQVMRPRVRMLPNMNPMTAATATKTAVHVPWADTAFNAMEILSMADPATKIQSGRISNRPHGGREA